MSLDDGLPRLPNIDSYVDQLIRASARRKLVVAAQNVYSRAVMGEDDPSEILATANGDFLNIAASDKRTEPRSAGQVLSDLGGVQALVGSGQFTGLPTGFLRFDDMTGGLKPGELMILAARPSMGKTALALNIATYVALKRNPAVTVIFSLEMSSESLMTRMVASQASVSAQRMRAGYLNSEERARLMRAASAIAEAPIVIDDSSASGVLDIGGKCRRIRAEYGSLGLVIVDYLQLMTGSGRFENRNQEVSAISRGLKLLAKDLGVPMLVLSQLSRAPEQRAGDHRPVLADLRESGAIEQDADLVAFIFREEVYKTDREELRGLAELHLAKQRNGPVGKIDLVFLNALTRFTNRAEDMTDSEEPPPGYDKGVRMD